MKNLLIAISMLATLLSTSLVKADHHGEPQYAALEAIFCNYKRGKGLEDVLDVAGEWDQWADTNVDVENSAWVLTPFINNSEDFPFDYVWLGATDNHESMGIAQDTWLSKGEKLKKKWDAVESCEGHSLMTGMVAKPFQSSTGHAFVQISGCELSEGKTMQDVMAADKKWVAWADEAGMPGGLLRWLPFAGDSRQNSTDLYSVYLTESMSDRGKAHDMMIKGGLAMLESTYNDVMSCDTPRIYHSTPVGGKTTG